MANTIKIKNSQTTTNTPGSLSTGELAINEADELLFYRDGGGVTQSFTLASLEFTSAEQTKLSGIATGAEVNTVDSVNTLTGAVVLDTGDFLQGATCEPWLLSTDYKLRTDNVFSVASQQTKPEDVIFASNGLKMYIVGETPTSIHEYDLSVYKDISSAVYNSNSFSYSGEGVQVRGMAMSPDGKKLITCDSTSNTLFEYDLGTAFDITSAVYSSNSFAVSAQGVTGAQDIFIRDDGLRAFITDAGTDTVYQYSMTAAFDLSTISYDSLSFDVSTQASAPTGAILKPDGLKMMVCDNGGVVYEYDLPTAWSLSGASYSSNSVDYSSTLSVLRDLCFCPGGETIFFVDRGANDVHQADCSSGLFYPVADREKLNGIEPLAEVNDTESILLDISRDETTALTASTGQYIFRMPYAFTLTEVRASVTTAPTDATIIVDINDGGTSIMTTNKLSIDATEKTSTTAATPPGITDTTLADDAEITIDVDQVGSTIAGAGLKVQLIGNR